MVRRRGSRAKILKQVTEAQQNVAQLASNVASVGQFILGLIFQVLTIGLFTFYLVADLLASAGPSAPCCRRGGSEILAAWEIAVDKTGGYLYCCAAISSLVAFFVLSILGVPFAIPLALFLGFISQFIPVIGVHRGRGPLLVALLEDPWTALFFLIYVVVYQQIENYLLAPRITARTMALHLAVAFFAALAGGSISGLLGRSWRCRPPRSSRPPSPRT